MKLNANAYLHLKAPPRFQFTKKLDNWNLEKIHLVVCVCLLMVYGHWLVVCGRLLVVCDRLCSFVMICGCLLSLPVLITTVLV